MIENQDDQHISLANGVKMPIIGLGVFLSKEGEEVKSAVHWALEAGYRHIDTAAVYRNEQGVGEAVRSSEVDRKDVFITSKLWNSEQGYDSAFRAFDKSLQKLQTDYLDMYLIHWPVKGKYKESWKALEQLYNAGHVKAIGLSNFMVHHIQDILDIATVHPVLNQIEFHPRLQSPELIEFCRAHNIQVESWSPLMQGKIFALEELTNIARHYNKSVAQLVIRWNIQHGIVTIPKSVNQHRIYENFDVFDFEISPEHMKLIDALDQGQRVGPDPDDFDF